MSESATKKRKKTDELKMTLCAARHTPQKRRCLCDQGTGEIVHVIHWAAKDGCVDAFECKVQCLANSLYGFETGVTDVRICHPKVGEVCFILTFLSRADLELFQKGPQRKAEKCLLGIIRDDSFRCTGTLMPAAHTLSSLLQFLKKNVTGSHFRKHDYRRVTKEMRRWYPRDSEYGKYVHFDIKNPKTYTRNLVFHNEHMDVILMCWPSGVVSSIHDHDSSSCWVVVVEGVVHEVQYLPPVYDRRFIESEMRNPTGARGKCSVLKQANVAKLSVGGVTSSYVNNDQGLHRIENRTEKPAYTLHVYAPPLRKMKIFDAEKSQVWVYAASATPYTSVDGKQQLVDAVLWNQHQQ